MSGAQAFAYGNPRAFVIGMKVALADGRIVKAGGRVVKNVAGYDLCKLFTGSYGTLGLILELIFKLKPVPAYNTTVSACGSLDSLLSFARSLLDARLLPVAIELLSPGVATRLAVSDKNHQPTLLVRYRGTHEAVVFQTERSINLIRETDAQIATYASDDDAECWRRLAALPVQAENKGLVWRASVLPTELQTFLKQVMTQGGMAFPQESLWHASVGNGKLRVINSAPDETSSCVASLKSLRERATALGGSLGIESAPQAMKDRIDVFGDAGAATKLMQRVKQQLDPAATLSPGRFVFNT
jgi:FAD/FMN-containing dehydrogenase